MYIIVYQTAKEKWDILCEFGNKSKREHYGEILKTHVDEMFYYYSWLANFRVVSMAFEPGFWIRLLTCRSGSLWHGSNQKCIKIQNVKAGNLSTTLLVRGSHNYRDNFSKTG